MSTIPRNYRDLAKYDPSPTAKSLEQLRDALAGYLRALAPAEHKWARQPVKDELALVDAELARHAAATQALAPIQAELTKALDASDAAHAAVNAAVDVDALLRAKAGAELAGREVAAAAAACSTAAHAAQCKADHSFASRKVGSVYDARDSAKRQAGKLDDYEHDHSGRLTAAHSSAMSEIAATAAALAENGALALSLFVAGAVEDTVTDCIVAEAARRLGIDCGFTLASIFSADASAAAE